MFHAWSDVHPAESANASVNMDSLAETVAGSSLNHNTSALLFASDEGENVSDSEGEATMTAPSQLSLPNNSSSSSNNNDNNYDNNNDNSNNDNTTSHYEHRMRIMGKKRSAVSPLRIQGGGALSHFRNSILNNPTTRSEISSSDFSLSQMPRDKIVKRTLHSWSVHHSASTSNWIATIVRPPSSSLTGSPDAEPKYIQFVFGCEREARKFCKAYAPPKMAHAAACGLCQKPGTFRHCRNCGINCCDGDSTRWGSRMLPKTYMPLPGSAVVRVCKACDWLSNAFCMALLQGRYEDALHLHDTGNINLRTCFADIHKEAMFPVHVAVMGGSLECLKWLVERELCPISARMNSKTKIPLSVQTSGSRTLLDLAMTGRVPKIEVLTYLVQQGLSVTDLKDASLATKTLEAVLKAGSCTSIGHKSPEELHVIESHDESVMSMTVDDACHICFERAMDCVLTPCGHQVCCTECGQQLERCPVCKASCSFLRVYRQ